MSKRRDDTQQVIAHLEVTSADRQYVFDKLVSMALEKRERLERIPEKYRPRVESTILKIEKGEQSLSLTDSGLFRVAVRYKMLGRVWPVLVLLVSHVPWLILHLVHWIRGS